MSCTLTRTLSAAFCTLPSSTVRDAELLRNCLEIFRLTLVFRGRGARDHFQIGDARELGQDFILNAIGEVSRALVVAQVFERQDGDRFWRNRRNRLALNAQPRLRLRYGRGVEYRAV